jgi:hypothetical protein
MSKVLLGRVGEGRHAPSSCHLTSLQYHHPSANNQQTGRCAACTCNDLFSQSQRRRYRPEPDSSEFPRVLKFKQQGNLFNPDTDTIPMRRTTEPEASSESAGSSCAPRQPADASRHNHDASQHRQLFDPRKHDPVSFSAAQARKPATTPPSHPFLLTPTRSSRQISHFRLARLMDPPRRLRFLITTNPATSRKRMRFRTSSRSSIATSLIWRRNFSLIRANRRMRTVSSLRVAHRPEPMKRRRRDGRT